MSDLQRVFEEALGASQLDGIVLGQGVADIGSRLTALYMRGSSVFPALALGPRAFVRHLAKCATGGQEGPVPVDQLAVEDLFLACACVERVVGATGAFEARCVGPIRAVLSTLTCTAPQREDIEQLVRVAVLVGSGGGPPKIASYLGRGSLGRWVGVVAQRIAFALLRSEGATMRSPVSSDEMSRFEWNDPGIALIKERYRESFQRAIEDALGNLAGRARVLIRLNLVEGVSTVKLAKMFGVTQPTVSRWLTEARADVAIEMKRLLAERLELPPQEIESLAGLVISQLHFNLSTLLATA